MKKEPHHWFPKAVNKYQSLTEVTATWLPFLAENPSHFGFQEEVVKKISSSVSDLFWFHFWSWFGAFFYFWVSKECAVPLPQNSSPVSSWRDRGYVLCAASCLPHARLPHLAECSEHTDTGLPS